MFKYIKNIAILAALSLSMFSCQEGGGHVQSKGMLSFNIVGSLGSFTPELKNVEATEIPIADYNVTITNLLTGNSVFDDKYSAILGDLELSIGSYNITVESQPLEDASFDCAYYAASKNFIIEYETVTKVDITCILSNVKVAVVLNDKFNDYYNDYNINISNGLSSLNFTPLTGKEGYFKATSTGLAIEFTGTNKVLNTTESKIYSITEINPRDLHTITFDVKDYGHGNIILEVSDDMINQEITLPLDPY